MKMFDTLNVAPPDAILGLSEAFRNDPRPHKINLTVGVYQDAGGKTPVLRCVKAAEEYLLEKELNKDYLGIAGIPNFDRHISRLVLGERHPRLEAGHVATVQTPGGTAALRVAADFLHRRFHGTSIWVSTPTWTNHPGIFHAAGLHVHKYPYLDASATQLDFPGMLAALETAPHGDVVCLHGCCHNPTGVDLTPDQWRDLAELLHRRQLLPLVDLAYQGFGEGLRADARAVEILADAVDEMLICSSYSKNFSLYAERVGALLVVAGTHEAAGAALSHVKAAVRANYSNPPKHGAAIVTTVLNDDSLREDWLAELAEMRNRILAMRSAFVEAMSVQRPDRDFTFINRQRGMFSYSGLTAEQVDRLREEHAIYIVGSGRINVAGITADNIDRLCTAIAAVL